VVFGPIIGPTLGGWITDTWGWPWVFYINIPLGMLGIALGLIHITDPEHLRKPEGSVDYWSFLFICLGLGSLEVVLNRGQRFDWFESNFIKLFALAAAVGIALFTWRSLTAERPLVNLRVFKNRSFASGTVLMFLLGFGLYGSFTMLPIYVQSIMGYTATWAGLVISPGGVASLLAMAIVGNLVGRVDARLLVLFGAICNVGALWVLKDLNLEVDFFHITLSRLFQGFGLGFLFVPITAAAFSQLRPEQIGQGTGLFNLLRNEGGSVGIAMSATVLARHSQLHQSRLADHVNAFSPIVQNRLTETAHGLFAGSGHDPVTSQTLTLQVLYGRLQQQAALFSFVDVFRMLMFAFVVFLPFVLLLGTGKGGRAAGAH
jgi:DHA2 family multidrug resistance protein